MLTLSVSNVSKSYGSQVILEEISFHMNKGDRIGIVGPNGAGKTTLLSILSGELSPDSGKFYLSGEETIGYLKQKNNSFSKARIYEEMLSIFEDTIQKEKRFKEISSQIARESQEDKLENLMSEYNALALDLENSHSFSYESQIKGMLSRMSFPEEYYHKEIDTLSGGERTRLALAALLLRKPSLLLLDEPTNHLDAETLGWLEQFLASYGGSLIIVSHDRYFLDKTANRIFEIENHTLTTFNGNYTSYAKRKKDLLEENLKRHNLQAREIARQEDLVRRLAQHKTEKLAKRAKSVQKRLDKMEVSQRPSLSRNKMSLHFKEKYASGNDVLFVRDLTLRYGLTPKLDMHIRKGEKVCMVGANGTGKTTFLNTLMEKISPVNGDFRFGQNVLKAYYDQQQALLHKDHTVLEEIHDDYRLYSESEIRGFLGRFNFHGDDVFKKVEDLSGGERAKLSLLKLMLSGANFLIMDEPTNHLDIQSKEAFEDAILNFPGTVLIVSHDRYLLNKIPDRIVDLTQDSFVEYPGKYDYYIEKKNILDGQGGAPAFGKGGFLQQAARSGADTPASGEAGPELDSRGRPLSLERAARAQARREAKAEEARRRRLARDIEKAEAEIHKLEEEVESIEAKLCEEKVFSDLDLSLKYSRRLEETKALLETAYSHWLELKE